MSQPQNVYLFFVLSDSATTSEATARNFADTCMAVLTRAVREAGHTVVDARIVTMEELAEMRTTMYDRVNVFFTSHKQIRDAVRVAEAHRHWNITVLTGGRRHGIVHVVDKSAYMKTPEDTLVDLLAGI